MAIVSDVEIRLRADIARLQQDMDRARQSVSSTMDRITSVAKGAMGALAAIGGVGLFAGFIKSAIDATDAVSDISQRTGVAVEDIAALQLWFQKGGNEAGVFEGAMIKLAREMGAGGEAFQRLGVRVTDSNGNMRSSMQVLSETADKFAKMPDGVNKTALAIDLFGKSGAQLIPMLNEGSEGLQEMTEMADRLGLTFDQKTVDAAGDFNDTLDFMGLAAQGVGRQVAAELLPTLNSLVGSMFTFATSGDGVRKAADVIATGFKTIYTIGVGVVTMFNTVANTITGSMSFVGNSLGTLFQALKQGIEGNYSDAWRTLTSGGMRAGAILTTTFDDVKRDMSAAATTISDVWTGAGGEAVAALAGMNRQTKTLTDAERKNAEKAAEAYRDLQSALRQHVEESAREAAGLEPLNAAQKYNLDLTEKLRAGKLKLAPAQLAATNASIAEWESNLAETAAKAALVKMNESLYQSAKEVSDLRAGEIKAATEELDANKKLVSTFGMTASAIAALEVARLKEQLAQRSSVGMTLDEIEHLEQLIALKERSAEAMASREELGATRDFWTDIEKTAHDTFRSITDGGKGMWQRLRETGKNMFFDWLYQMTAKKWLINIGTAVSGTAGVSGIASAAEAASSGGGVMGTIGNLYGAVSGGMSLAGGLGTGFMGSLAGGLNGAGIGSGLTSSIGLQMGSSIASVVGPSVAGAISSGLGALAAAAPYAAIAVAVYALAKKAFGMGPKEYTGTSELSGWINGNGGLDANTYADWTKKGGWLRSDKGGSDRMPVDQQLAAGILSTYETIKTSTADFAKALGLNADHIANRAQGISIALGKDDAENQKTIAAFFSGAADAIAREVLPSMDLFQREGETAAQTLQRMATNAAGMDQVLASLGVTMAEAFGPVTNVSMLARERLVDLAGGVQNLATMASFFTQNILTEEDRAKAAMGPLREAMGALGFASVTTVKQFKDAAAGLLKSGALATEEGAKQYAGLLGLAPQFKLVADYMAQVQQAADDEAAAKLADQERDLADARERAAQALRDNEQALLSFVDKSLAALGRAVDAQKNIVTAAYQQAMGQLEKQIEGVSAAVGRNGQLSQALKAAMGAAPGGEASSRRSAQAQITAALAVAKASGVLPSLDDLRDALSTVAQDGADDFATLADYQRSVARTNAELEALGGLTDKELNAAERQLALLQDQKGIMQMAHEAELRRLDGILTAAHDEVNAIKGVDTRMLSVVEALGGVRVALAALKMGATPTNPTGGALSVEDLYRVVLGRDGEAAGVAFWKKAFGEAVDQTEYLEFVKAAQPELAAPPVVAPAYGTMGNSSASVSVEQQQINARLEANTARTAAAVEQLAQQFHMVSGGGNLLGVEVI